MSGTWVLFAFAAGGLSLAAVVSSVLAALLERPSPIRLSHWMDEAGGRLEKLYESPRRFEAFRFLLSTGAKLSAVALGVLLAQVRPTTLPISAPVLALLVVGSLLSATELLNRRLVRRDPEGALQGLTTAYRMVLVPTLPLVSLLAPFMPNGEMERKEEDEDEISDQELDAFIDVGTREGILDPEESELVRSVVDFGDTWVRSVMTPRIDIVCAPVSESLEDLATVFVESTHSRIPLFDNTIDQIVGSLHLRDLMRGLRSQDMPSARDLVKPILFVPESKPLGEVLKELQEGRQQMAVVVDEYGGTSGLVTIEDLLEEIVGEIVDQDEELPPQALALAGGGWRLDGRIRIDELARIFDLTLEDESVDTVAGMVFSAFGYVPEVGETLDIGGLHFVVEEVSDRRIQTVRVEALQEPREPEVVDAV